MKKTFLLIQIVFLLGALSINAASVSRQEASNVAATFLKQPSVEEVAVPFEHLYVFNGDHCFVIVPDDDVVTPMIGYSRDCCFEMNDNLKGCLMVIDGNIQACRDSGKQPSDKVQEMWNALRNGQGMPMANRAVVEPLVKTRWGQNRPYNDNCPGGSVTGCSATAMAQVMKYWEFPNHGIGSHSYNHPEFGTLSANFGATTYDWDHMPFSPDASTVSDVERQALSTLMYHCGVSIDMDYGLDESSGDLTKMTSTLPAYFGYAPTVQWLYQRNYTEAAWKSMLKAELDALRPMCYVSAFPQEGMSRASFHAFVCDGYDEMDYFHLNWGWTGSGDGYYDVFSMIPVGETNFNYVVLGINPLFVVSAPNDLAAVSESDAIRLSWTQPQGTATFNVYRDDELIATGVTATTYCDTEMSYGVHSYYLKALDANGNRSWKSNSAEAFCEFTAPAPIALDATLAGDSLTLHWEMTSPWHDTLAYGTGPIVGSYGYSPTYPNPTFWGQRFPAEMLRPYGGYVIKGVSLYVNQSGSYTLNVCRGDDKGVTEVMAQQSFEVSQEGWQDLLLDTPYPLEFTRDVWVVMNTPAGMYWVSAACDYDGPGKENAAFYSVEMSDSFFSVDASRSWMMKTILEDGLTYRVNRNDELLATVLHGHTFVDHGIAAGEWDYKVWASYQGMENNEPVSFSISVARVDAFPDNSASGTVDGNGLYEVGSTATVTAQPNDGYRFVGWSEGGTVIATDNPYTFAVSGSRNLTAVFESNHGVDEDVEGVRISFNRVKDELHVESTSLIRRLEIVALNGVTIENKRVDGYSVECHFGNYADGMYLLRLFVEEGVVTKKIVVP